MKKLLFLALPLLLFSCKGVEQYKAGIDELAGNWDSTTTAVTDFSGMVSEDLTKYTQALAKFDDLADVNLNAEQTDAMEGAKMAVINALGGYPPLQKNINEFVSTWTDKAAELTALKDGLAAGKIEGDVPAKISELSGLVDTANENLTSWKGTYDTLKGDVDESMAALTQLMASFASSK